MTDVRQQIIDALTPSRVKAGQTHAEAIADAVLAIPAIRDALRQREMHSGVILVEDFDVYSQGDDQQGKDPR